MFKHFPWETKKKKKEEEEEENFKNSRHIKEYCLTSDKLE